MGDGAVSINGEHDILACGELVGVLDTYRGPWSHTIPGVGIMVRTQGGDTYCEDRDDDLPEGVRKYFRANPARTIQIVLMAEDTRRLYEELGRIIAKQDAGAAQEAAGPPPEGHWDASSRS